ncbi:MAG: hypothetical protein FWE31_01480 [Firmicutes bacterium]|nr:hypothetical protein [Bacillota bacterium]
MELSIQQEYYREFSEFFERYKDRIRLNPDDSYISFDYDDELGWHTDTFLTPREFDELSKAKTLKELFGVNHKIYYYHDGQIRSEFETLENKYFGIFGHDWGVRHELSNSLIQHNATKVRIKDSSWDEYVKNSPNKYFDDNTYNEITYPKSSLCVP